ncbi:hypothetical protein GCM10009655_09200 [Rhodoglobus aureus]|uniref:Uncharacterized protein n=2 Tax=Rhodoglobus aureus TaxID=191497 RepID=A0ABN1VJH2_9MICO
MISGSGVGNGEELADDDALGVLDGLGDAPPVPEGTQPASATVSRTADAAAAVVRARPPVTIAEFLSLRPFMPEA